MSGRKMVGRGRRTALPAVALLLAASAAGGCDGAVSPARTYRTVLTIDAGPLFSSTQSHVATVIDFAEVTVLREDGGTSRFQAPLDFTQSTAQIDVRVPAGTHRFQGRVISNNGTVLVEGTRTVEVRGDGFTVDLDTRVLAPVMVVFPDSVETRAADQGDAVFTIGNIGADTLAWQILSMDPPQSACEGGCFRFSPAAGQVGPGGAGQLRVFGPSNPAFRGLYRLRLGSPVGTVELKIFAETG